MHGQQNIKKRILFRRFCFASGDCHKFLSVCI